VFVYKLIVAGSIEEKILALQERKAELAEGILAADGNAIQKFGEDDIAALFAPQPF
jgi:SNF2 family DNA or RNA helicase